MNLIIVNSIGTIPHLNKRQSFKIIVQTLPFKLFISGLLIAIWAFIYKFILLEIEAPYAFFVPLGDLGYGVALSVIASIIFYFITVFIPKYQSKKKINGVIERNLFQLVKLSDMIMYDITRILYFDEDKKEKWMSDCVGDLMNDGPKKSVFNPYGEKISWADYFEAILFNEDHYIEILRDYRQYLPEDVLLLINDIENNDGFRSALRNYENMYGRILTSSDGKQYDLYRNIEGFNNVLWNHMNNLHQILPAYQMSVIS